MPFSEIDRLIKLLARLPGLGPRSARRAVLSMIRSPESLMLPLATAIRQAAEAIRVCATCGNLDVDDPCAICRDRRRDRRMICVVEQVGDLWAIERSGAYKGLYHVLGGTLSALDGRGPDQLNVARLLERVSARPGNDPDVAPGDAPGDAPEGAEPVAEVILALGVTVDGQTTAHYLAERLVDAGAGTRLAVTRLAQGVPVGGELDYLDDGTLSAALKARRPA